MKDLERTSNGGANIFTVLFVVFLVLKLVGVIDWSWWYVTMPLWAPVLFVIAAIVAYVGTASCISFVRGMWKWNRRRRVARAHEKAREAEIKAQRAEIAEALSKHVKS